MKDKINIYKLKEQYTSKLNDFIKDLEKKQSNDGNNTNE